MCYICGLVSGAESCPSGYVSQLRAQHLSPVPWRELRQPSWKISNCCSKETRAHMRTCQHMLLWCSILRCFSSSSTSSYCDSSFWFLSWSWGPHWFISSSFCLPLQTSPRSKAMGEPGLHPAGNGWMHWRKLVVGLECCRWLVVWQQKIPWLWTSETGSSWVFSAQYFCKHLDMCLCVCVSPWTCSFNFFLVLL